MEIQYITASEMAKIWKISHRRVQFLCANNRIIGAFKLGETWAIPIDTEKPADARLKKGNNAHV